MTMAALLLTSAAASSGAPAAQPAAPRLSFWAVGPVDGGCTGWGMPFPGYSAEDKAQPSCWNNTVALIAQHADMIDELNLVAGLVITNVSKGLLDFNRDGLEWGPGFRMKPEAWWPHFVPELQAILKPGTKIIVPFDFGGGTGQVNGNSTAVASGRTPTPTRWRSRWCSSQRPNPG